MSKIFEIFGYPVNDRSLEAEESRRTARCPFMGQERDGGGNRYSSSVVVKGNQALEDFFGSREKVAAGVCSIQLHDDASPWIVCPIRLLVLGRQTAGTRVYQQKTEQQVLQLLDYEPGTRLGVWPEVKLKYEEEVNGIRKTFDYTFDYILMPVGPEDAPYGIPSIIEIMTSSTSGGNKDKGTTISNAFKDAITGQSHRGPGINYRQIWARMLSQLIVKSEVALGWHGKAIWVVQDTLIDYISRSTALNIRDFASEHVSEVNMLC